MNANQGYRVFPLQTPRLNGKAKRPVRWGRIEENAETEKIGVAGMFGVVTHEEDGLARVYVYTLTGMDDFFPHVPLWRGPYSLLAEEVLIPEEA